MASFIKKIQKILHLLTEKGKLLHRYMQTGMYLKASFSLLLNSTFLNLDCFSMYIRYVN